MEFTFAGSSVALYGVFDWKTSGSVTVEFTITNPTSENSSAYNEEKSFFVSSAPYPTTLLNSTNYLLFEHSSLAPGNHTLKLNVTGIVQPRTFTIDYLTYEPSFDSLDAKPNFTSIQRTSSGSNRDSPSGNVGTSFGKSSNTRAIVGGVVSGGVAMIVSSLFVWYLCYRRQKIRKDTGEFGTAFISSSEVANLQVDQNHNSNPSPSTDPRRSFRIFGFLRSSRNLQNARGTGRTNSSSSTPSTSTASTVLTPFPYGVSTNVTRSKGESLQQCNKIPETMAHLPAATDPVTSPGDAGTQLTERIKLLEERIESLSRENERLGGYGGSGPPPVYMYRTTADSSVPRVSEFS
ncbi:hypothetical protein VKT23_008192 [Stygiomarasmius scandens]|uniref:Uncharacterized protein n=1 Tax=Marasmiellus scandens TaxID=2682957 RepID=A0ABR1JIC9_9AGAR